MPEVVRGPVRLQVELDGEGPPLLFLHGLGGLGSLARTEVPPGYRVAVYDQRGHGSATPCTDPAGYAIEEFVADALAVLDHLGWDRATVGGTSMGSAVALRIALDHPERVDALLLSAPAFGDVPSAAVPTFDGMAGAVESMGVDGLLDALGGADALPPGARERLTTWRAHDPASLAVALRTVGRWAPFPDLAELRPLDVPVAIAAWPGDEMHPMELAERLAERLGTTVADLGSAERVLDDRTTIARALAGALAERGPR